MSGLFSGAPLAAAQDQAQTGDQNVYGWQLMTHGERDEYRARLRDMKTEEEREAFRLEHREQMQERAREQGVILPGMQARGQGMGRQRPGKRESFLLHVAH